MALKLYSISRNPNAFKALIAAEYAGVKVELVPDFQMGVTNKTEEFLKLNPIGKIPVLVTPSGPIFESNAIMRYIARLSDSGLYGSSVYESALVDQWLDFATNEVANHLYQWNYPIFGWGPRIPQIEEKAKTNLARGLGALDKHLASNTYLVGHSVTLADIALACTLLLGYFGVLSKAYMRAYPHVNRLFFTLVHQPQFAKVLAALGPLEQLDETPTEVLPPEKNPMLRGQPTTPASKPAEPAPATPPQPEAPPAAAEAAPAEAEAAPAPSAPGADPRTAGLLDEEEAPKPKAPKNPLDLLPPSPMVLDAWKRLYSNTKAAQFRDVAIKGFWEMYDPEGYSLWFCDFKYNEENTVRFITLNKVGGFLQRMDLVRKWGFAKMCILGPDAGPFVIKGVWLFRGPDVPQLVKDEVGDYELYEWTKADISNEEQKERINAYFEEPDDVDGLKLQEAKCFK